MQHILSTRNHPVLKRFAGPNTLVAFDFDGTLARIVAQPDQAAMRRSTKALLARLTARFPCVVISGRALKDVRARLRGVGMQGLVGNHGIEPWSTLPAIRKIVRGWMPLLKSRLQDFPGVVIEDKEFSVTVHYRGAAHTRKVRAAVAGVAKKLGGVRLVGGKHVINIMLDGTPHKGIALQRELRRLACDKAIFVGDADTDEDAFALHHPERLLTVRIGRKKGSHARYYLRNQREIDRFLRVLLELRAGSGLPSSAGADGAASARSRR
jgi:trehalose 6-phosphate phosphatase